MSELWGKFVKERLSEYGIQKGSSFEAKLYLAFNDMESIFSNERQGFKLKISKLEAENAELKARLAHVENELEKEREVVEFYGDCKNVDYCTSNEWIEEVSCVAGYYDEFGKRARQRIKERKEFK